MDALRIEALAGKEESTYGTDASPDPNADGIRVVERLYPQLRPEWAFQNRRNDVANNSLLPSKPATRVGRIITLEIPWELRGAGSAYAAETDIEAWPLFAACGLSASVDNTAGSEKVTITPADSGHGSATLHAWAGGLVWKLVGCRATGRWPVTAGENGILRFEVQGILSEAPSTASVPAHSYLAQLPAAAVGMNLSLDSWAAPFRSSTFDLGNTVERHDDGNADDGVDGFHIPEMDPRYSIEVRKEALTDYNPYAKSDGSAATTIDQELGTGGDGASYNRVRLDIDDAYLLQDPDPIEYGQYAGWSLEYEMTDWSLIFD